MAGRVRGEPDPQREQAGSWGGGTYGSSRLSLLEIQMLSISCKDTQVGQRRNNLALPCDGHLNIPTPLPVPGIMQGAAKTPSVAQVPTTVCCSCWNLRLMFWAQKKPKEPIFSSA